jgi:hypothetical protein
VNPWASVARTITVDVVFHVPQATILAIVRRGRLTKSETCAQSRKLLEQLGERRYRKLAFRTDRMVCRLHGQLVPLCGFRDSSYHFWFLGASFSLATLFIASATSSLMPSTS